MSESLQLQFVDSIDAIGQADWNRLSGVDYPFLRYEFLHALEATGCTSSASGWEPHHVVVTTGDQPRDAEAVMPLFIKTNSWGEYVFDWSWANAYQSHGLNYYPKLVTAAPFTPSAGPRIFTADPGRRSEVVALIVEGVKQEAERLGASSWHVLFPQQAEHDCLAGLGMQSRIATQFHWHNAGYESFDEFLTALNSRKRKSIRKERKQVRDQGVSFTRTEGADISEQQWQDFYLYYQSTYLMRGMQGYLKLGFFKSLAQTMPEQLLLIGAQQDGAEIAAALFFKSADSLFGRYWGCRQERQFLHFETCYYQGLDYAIEHGQTLFDSGAQGEHKIQRGFEPVTTFSNHWLAHPGFSDAIANFLKQERPHIDAYQAEARTLLPFRRDS